MHKYLSQPAWLHIPLPCMPLAAWEAHTSAVHHMKGKYWLVNQWWYGIFVSIFEKPVSPQYVKAV